ncbi:MAG TPA: OmpA family protein [Bacteroidales bacterium]|jgi:outer membrane protein OmpA-like peptidoglycan-associated protein|nr:PD40 domain-containing protein [Bacteroidales bacterium]HPB25892.1 OmpA family protein [Bacteroidales bacterium]HPI30702.1 OmpA family protein [Bacteroidales bacterium]HQN16571.1 OmpA family protein [Bacteroidales bacterium]HQP16186.1 OmpA family protein [Bacteroidales bacterium]
MKKGYFIIISALLLTFFSSAQNVEFVKSNFKGREKEFKQARNNFTVGLKYYEMGKSMYATALEYFLEAQKFNPDNAKLNYLIGTCYLNTVQKTKSIEYFEKSLLLNAVEYKDTKFNLAKAYQLNGEYDRALGLIRQYKQSLSPADLQQYSKEIEKRIMECENGKKMTASPVRVFIDNLGPIVNSAFPEYSPLINADESVLFFTSRRDNTTGGKRDENDLGFYEDIYMTEKINGAWTAPKNPPNPLNGSKHDATVGLSPDGQTLLIYKGVNGGDIYECKLKGTAWSTPSRIGGDINTDFHESSGTISYDGKNLYFVSDRDGGFGGNDIYISVKDKKGNWGKPQNLGAGINTPYNEEGVFIHPDGKTLYFSSQGHTTMGGYDIFKSVFDGTKWGEPENIGYPINTPDDDVFFSISASGVHGYYSSIKQDGLGGQDIYVITFLGPEKPLINNTEDNLLAGMAQPVNETVIEKPVEIKENQVTLLKGIVMDDITLEPLGATIEITDNERNEVIGTYESNSATGKYLVSLPSGKNYGIAVKAPEYLFHSENIIIPPTTTYREVEKDIKLKKVAVGSTIVLKNIFFDFDKFSLRPESIPELERLLKFMTELPSVKIEISGHTDNIGAAAYNKTLSENRAKAVVDYLVGKGIDKNRMTYKGFGFDQPIATNDTEEGRQLNRRTEFKIISK